MCQKSTRMVKHQNITIWEDTLMVFTYRFSVYRQRRRYYFRVIFWNKNNVIFVKNGIVVSNVSRSDFVWWRTLKQNGFMTVRHAVWSS